MNQQADYKIAQLSKEEMKQIEALENHLGITLVAYEPQKNDRIDEYFATSKEPYLK